MRSRTWGCGTSICRALPSACGGRSRPPGPESSSPHAADVTVSHRLSAFPSHRRKGTRCGWCQEIPDTTRCSYVGSAAGEGVDGLAVADRRDRAVGGIELEQVDPVVE